jgi:hypothetical protein
MKPRIRTVLIALLITAWALPGVRAVCFFRYASRVYQEEQSLNAWNDAAYGVALIGACLVSLATPVAFLFLRRMNASFALVLVGACLLIAADVIRIHPEEVIVLVPSMNPLRPIRWTAITIFLGGMLYLWQNRRSQQTAPPASVS